jgi:uncharacterized protein
MTESLPVAKNETAELHLLPALANRHGLIAGATGTGKTITLQVLAEGFSRIGVPVFLADVKGDLSGMAAAGTLSPKLKARLDGLSLEEPAWEATPVVFWDVFGERGHPVRATISDLGPLLLGRLLNLNETQQGVLTLVFKLADESGLLLLDLKDLRAMLQFVAENARELTTSHGNVSAASVGAIQRGLLTVEHQGGERFFGEPMLDIADLLKTDTVGRGVVNILAAERLLEAPKVYATFLLWILSELFERLPEVGDPEKPKLVFFFDEAHLLFKDAPKALLDKVEQVVRLVRSKGVGVYIVTQNPTDVPNTVLAQLGNRVQHALRAFTPRDRRVVQAAAETLRANPSLDTVSAIMELEVGEALVSLLDGKGRPAVVERAFVLPPSSRMGPLTEEERARVLACSVVAGHYEQALDRPSAFEMLQQRATGAAPANSAAGSSPAGRGEGTREAALGGLAGVLLGRTGPRGGRKEGLFEAAARSAARSIGSQVGRQLLRGVLGSRLGGGRR